MTFRNGVRRGLRLLAAVFALAVAVFAAIIFKTAGTDCLPAARSGPITDENTVSGGLIYSVSRSLSPFFGDLVGRVRTRSGRLSDDAAVELALGQELQPFDVLIQKNGFALSDTFIPGYFTHAVIYLGTPEQLKAAGVWDLKAFDPVRAQLVAGNSFIEIDRAGAHLVAVREAVNTDELAVLRIAPPKAAGAEWPGQIAERLLASLGKPYDFAFDADTASEVTCAEVVMRSFTHIAWPLREIMGRRSLLPDDVLRTALDGQSGVQLLAFHTPGYSYAASEIIPQMTQRLAQCAAHAHSAG